MLAKLIHFLETLRVWMEQHPQSSVFAFAGIFLVVQMFMFPVSPLGMAAGLFFGFWKGFGTLMFGCALGATLNFFLVRWVARDFVRRKLGTNKAFQMIDTAIAREGWRIVALMRLVPIPFGMANYCYGLTPIPYVPYLLASCAAIIPANALFVWMGSTFHGELSTLVSGHGRHPMEYVFLAVGIIAAVLVLRVVAKTAKAHLERDAALGRPEPKEDAPHEDAPKS